MGNLSKGRQSLYPRTLSPIVCEINHDSRDHVALCSALTHIRSVTVKGPVSGGHGLCDLLLSHPLARFIPCRSGTRLSWAFVWAVAAVWEGPRPLLPPLKSARVLLSRFLARGPVVVGTQKYLLEEGVTTRVNVESQGPTETVAGLIAPQVSVAKRTVGLFHAPDSSNTARVWEKGGPESWPLPSGASWRV